ncbi:MAG: hypothetical protein WKF94_16345 [Solirubrobacteraceae bacterium]
MARTFLTAIDIAIDAVPQASETTIGAVGGHAVILTTTLPTIGVTLTSSYLAAMVGDIAASHLCSVPGGPPIIDQHVLPGQQPGRTHAQACVLDHVAEVRNVLDAFCGSVATVTVTIADDTLEHADRAWSGQDQPPAT